MRRIATAVALTAALLSSTPAHADPEVSALQMGQSDKGWVSTTCTGTGTTLACDLRIPEGMKVWRIKYFHGGDRIATEKNYPSTPGPHSSRSLVVMKPVGEVRVACETKGGLALCEVRIRARVTDFDITLYAAQSMQGGLIGEDFTP